MPDLPLEGPSSSEPSFPGTDRVLLTADEVAAILRVPRSWVYGHLHQLPVVRLGRYVRFRRRGIDRLADDTDLSDELGPCE